MMMMINNNSNSNHNNNDRQLGLQQWPTSPITTNTI